MAVPKGTHSGPVWRSVVKGYPDGYKIHYHELAVEVGAGGLLLHRSGEIMTAAEIVAAMDCDYGWAFNVLFPALTRIGEGQWEGDTWRVTSPMVSRTLGWQAEKQLLIPGPAQKRKKPGPKPTGKALTGAERQQRHKAKQKNKTISNGEDDGNSDGINPVTTTDNTVTVKGQHVDIVDDISGNRITTIEVEVNGTKNNNRDNPVTAVVDEKTIHDILAPLPLHEHYPLVEVVKTCLRRGHKPEHIRAAVEGAKIKSRVQGGVSGLASKLLKSLAQCPPPEPTQTTPIPNQTQNHINDMKAAREEQATNIYNQLPPDIQKSLQKEAVNFTEIFGGDSRMVPIRIIDLVMERFASDISLK